MHLISIIGAGPGNPELLTLKAAKRLRQANVVLFDALVSEEVLGMASQAIKICVGISPGDHKNPIERQKHIHELFHNYALLNRKVIRLKSGDPMIYGRSAEDISYCLSNGLNYEVVPGVTTALAASAEFEIPLTERTKSSMVLITTGKLGNKQKKLNDFLVNYIHSGTPIVMYMGLTNLYSTISMLRNSLSQSIDVHILSNVSLDSRKRVSGNLNNIIDKIEKENPPMPALIIIGKDTKPLSETIAHKCTRSAQLVIFNKCHQVNCPDTL